MVSALSTVYAVEGGDVSNTDKLSQIIQKQWPLATGMSLLVWFIFAPQCVSTFSTVRRELKSTRLMLMMFVYYFALAYVASWIAYSVTLAFT
jgi:ferrous iron transport protein B